MTFSICNYTAQFFYGKATTTEPQYPQASTEYDDFKSFITSLNKLTFLNFSLPTKDQWLYAAKGGLKSKGYTYCGSNNPEEVAWYSANSDGKAHPVKQLVPNELGIYDMSGNVAEYTATSGQGEYWYDGYGVTFWNYMFCGGSYLSANCKILEESLPKNQGDDMTKLDYVGFRLILTTN